jgi:hypothetical protein
MMQALVLRNPMEPVDQHEQLGGNNIPIEDRVKISIIRDLANLDWHIVHNNGSIEIVPPASYDKETVKRAMSIKRDEILRRNLTWINKHIAIARQNLADGPSALNSHIRPEIEVCETENQHSLFRIFRYYWSSPYSEYVGRRMRLLIRDSALLNKPLIGIAALGSPIIHIPERDSFIGWDTETRTNNLIYAMDAYVIGALPPYNYLLGGKLISYILASNEVRKIYRQKYTKKLTVINQRKSGKLVCLFTTGLYGKSSQYNRIKYNDSLLYNYIGDTKGYGTLHLTEQTICLIREFLASRGIDIGHTFGDGPSWTMRLIRTAGDLLGFDSDFLLRHSFRRSIYYIPLAENAIEILNGRDNVPRYYDYSLNRLVTHWKNRWLLNRKQDESIREEVLSFNPDNFVICPSEH